MRSLTSYGMNINFYLVRDLQKYEVSEKSGRKAKNTIFDQSDTKVKTQSLTIQALRFLTSQTRMPLIHLYDKLKPVHTFLLFFGVVSSYQIGLILSSVAEIHPKIDPSRCNLQFSICSHAGGKVLSLGNHHSLF